MKEKMKCLNNQFLAQIVALQNTQAPLPLPERPTATEATSSEQPQSWRHRRAASPHFVEAIRWRVKFYSSPHEGSTWLFSKEDREIHQDLDKFVQKRIEEASMPHHGRFKVIATDASNFSFSEDILEYEFLKKFMISTFDCYSG